MSDHQSCPIIKHVRSVGHNSVGNSNPSIISYVLPENIHFLFVYLPATITEKLKKIKITKNTPLETETNTGTKLWIFLNCFRLSSYLWWAVTYLWLEYCWAGPPRLSWRAADWPRYRSHPCSQPQTLSSTTVFSIEQLQQG